MEVLQAKNLKKIYGSGNNAVHALDGVDLSVKKGEFVAIVGTSGSGKSTLLHMLGGLDRPTSGTVMVDGQDIFSLKEEALTIFRRRKIGFVFQSYNLVPVLNVYENIILPTELDGGKVNKAFVQQIVQTLGLSDRLDALPNQLSGGQQQRVAIARALAAAPAIILADEPTGNLDSKTSQDVLSLLKVSSQKFAQTIVMITHEMAVVKEICDHVAIMEHGQVVEQGEVFSLFADPKQPITQNFIRTTSNLQKIEELIAEGSPVVQLQPGEVIVRLSYIQKNVSEPLISTLSQRFQISLNIIFADIEIVQDAPIGGTVAILSGEREQITKAMEYLIEKNVGVEVLKDARVTH